MPLGYLFFKEKNVIRSNCPIHSHIGVGKKSNIHKYYVLRKDEPSNLIPSHLYKDGLRHIHYDSKQARSITVREAARLQRFPDWFNFIGTETQRYYQIGNAVAPNFAYHLASNIKDYFTNDSKYLIEVNEQFKLF